MARALGAVLGLGVIVLGVYSWRPVATITAAILAGGMAAAVLRESLEWEEATPRVNEVRQSGGRWYVGPRAREARSGRSDSTGARRSARDRPADNRDYVRKDVGPAPLRSRGKPWALLLGLGLAALAGGIVARILI